MVVACQPDTEVVGVVSDSDEGSGGGSDGVGEAASTEGGVVDDSGSSGTLAETSTGDEGGDSSTDTGAEAVCPDLDPFALPLSVFATTGDVITDGTSNCDVLGTEPLELQCSGAFSGSVSIVPSAELAPFFAIAEVGVPIEIEYHSDAHPSRRSEWLKLVFAARTVVAAQADALVPPTVGMEGWYSGYNSEVDAGGCPDVVCPGAPERSVHVQRVTFGYGPTDFWDVPLYPGETGVISEKVDEFHPYLLNAVAGTCEDAGPEQWYVYFLTIQ